MDSSPLSSPPPSIPPNEGIAPTSMPSSVSQGSPVMPVGEVPIAPDHRDNGQTSATVSGGVQNRRLRDVSGVLGNIQVQEYLAHAQTASPEMPELEDVPPDLSDSNRVYSPETGEPSREMTHLAPLVPDADAYRQLFLDESSGQDVGEERSGIPDEGFHYETDSDASDETVRVQAPRRSPNHPRWRNVEETPAEAEAGRQMSRRQAGVSAALTSVMSNVVGLNHSELDDEGALRPAYNAYEPAPVTRAHPVSSSAGNILASRLHQVPGDPTVGTDESSAWLEEENAKQFSKASRVAPNVPRDNLPTSSSLTDHPPTTNLSTNSAQVPTELHRSERLSQQSLTSGDDLPALTMDTGTGAMYPAGGSGNPPPGGTAMSEPPPPIDAMASTFGGDIDTDSLGNPLDTFYDAPTSPRQKITVAQGHQQHPGTPASRRSSALSFASNSSYKTAPTYPGQQRGPQHGAQHFQQQGRQPSGSQYGPQYGPQGGLQGGPQGGLQSGPQNGPPTGPQHGQKHNSPKQPQTYGPNNPPPPLLQEQPGLPQGQQQQMNSGQQQPGQAYQNPSHAQNMSQGQAGQKQWQLNNNQNAQQIQQMGYTHWQRQQQYFQYTPQMHPNQGQLGQHSQGMNGPQQHYQAQPLPYMPPGSHFPGSHGGDPMMPMHGQSPTFFGQAGGYGPYGQPPMNPMHPYYYPPGTHPMYMNMGSQNGYQIPHQMPPPPGFGPQPQYYQGITGDHPGSYHPPVGLPPMAHQLPPSHQPPFAQAPYISAPQQPPQQVTWPQESMSTGPSVAAVVNTLEDVKLTAASTSVVAATPGTPLVPNDNAHEDDKTKDEDGKEQFTFKAAQARLKEELKRQGLPDVDFEEAARNAQAKTLAANRGRGAMRGSMGARGTGHRGGFRGGHSTGTPHSASAVADSAPSTSSVTGTPHLQPLYYSPQVAYSTGSVAGTPQFQPAAHHSPQVHPYQNPPQAHYYGMPYAHGTMGQQSAPQGFYQVQHQGYQQAVPHAQGGFGQHMSPQVPQQASFQPYQHPAPQVPQQAAVQSHQQAVPQVPGIQSTQIRPPPGLTMPAQPPTSHPAQLPTISGGQSSTQPKQSRFFPAPTPGLNIRPPPGLPIPPVRSVPPTTPRPAPPPPTPTPAPPRAPTTTPVPESSPPGKMSDSALRIHTAYTTAMSRRPTNLSPRSAKRWVPPGHFSNGLDRPDPVSGLSMIDWYSEDALANNPGLLELTGVSPSGTRLPSGYNNNNPAAAWAHPTHLSYLAENAPGTYRAAADATKAAAEESAEKRKAQKKQEKKTENTRTVYGGALLDLSEPPVPASTAAAPSVFATAPQPPVAPPVQHPVANTLPTHNPVQVHPFGFEIPGDKRENVADARNPHVRPRAAAMGTAGLDAETEESEEEGARVYGHVVGMLACGLRLDAVEEEG